MTSPFAARRKGKVIAQDEGEEGTGSGQDALPKEINDLVDQGNGSSSPQVSFKPRKKAASRISFGTSGTSMTEDGDDSTPAVFTAKKSKLSRQAIEKNALLKSMGASLLAETAPLQHLEDRPSYSVDYLNELKSSTPSAPRDLVPASTAETEEGKAIDLAAKFGSDLSVYENSTIPTDAEIREKKARRARLAKEEEFINLHGSDESDNEENQISLAPEKDIPETRLVRDDEDIAEGFDEYVNDGRIAMSRKAEREQKRKQKSDMAALINEAEGGSSSEETDDSEVERRQAYETAQTRAGMDGLPKTDGYGQPQRPRTPPKITPLPTLNGCLEKLRAELSKIQYEKMLRVKKLDEIRKDKAEMAEREVNIHRLLQEAGENYAKLQSQIGGELAAATNGHVMLENGNMNPERGLDSLGTRLSADVEMTKDFW